MFLDEIQKHEKLNVFHSAGQIDNEKKMKAQREERKPDDYYHWCGRNEMSTDNISYSSVNSSLFFIQEGFTKIAEIVSEEIPSDFPTWYQMLIESHLVSKPAELILKNTEIFNEVRDTRSGKKSYEWTENHALIEKDGRIVSAMICLLSNKGKPMDSYYDLANPEDGEMYKVVEASTIEFKNGHVMERHIPYPQRQTWGYGWGTAQTWAYHYMPVIVE